MSPFFVSRGKNMILFCKSKHISDYQILIPMNRVYNIRCTGSKIFINYDDGDLIEVDNSNYQPRVGTLRIEFENSSEAENKLREFYVALNNCKQAFYFAN